MTGKLIITVLLSILFVMYFRMSHVFQPVVIQDSKTNTVEQLIKVYGITKPMATAIWNAHVISGYNPVFITELILSESNFNPNLVSPKGYKGILQTPTKTGYINTDLIYGIEILMEKFRQYPNTLDAIAAYKGGKDNPLARKQAKVFLMSYKRNIQ